MKKKSWWKRLDEELEETSEEKKKPSKKPKMKKWSRKIILGLSIIALCSQPFYWHWLAMNESLGKLSPLMEMVIVVGPVGLFMMLVCHLVFKKPEFPK